MKINMTAKQKLTLFYFLAIIPFVPIDYVTFLFPLWPKITEVGRILLLVFFVGCMVKARKKPSLPLAVAIVYFLGCFVSTFLADIKYSTLVGGGLYLFGMTLLIEDGVSRDVDAMIDGMLLFFEILIYANLLYYLLHSAGYLVHAGYRYDSLFGNRNTVIRQVFPGIVLGATRAFRTKEKITLRFACMFLSLIFYLLRVRAMTATMGMLVFASAIVWYSFRKKSGIFKYEYFAVLSGWISIQFAVLRRFAFAQGFITKILRKNMMLSGRIRIWRRMPKVISARSFFGYGQLRYNRVPGLIRGADPHNVLLGTLFYGGIFGLVILILMLIIFGRKIYIDRKQGRRLLFIFEAGLCATFVMWCFEPYTAINNFYKAYILLVMAYYCKEFEKGRTL